MTMQAGEWFVWVTNEHMWAMEEQSGLFVWMQEVGVSLEQRVTFESIMN